MGLTGTVLGRPLFRPVVVRISVRPTPRRASHDVTRAILRVDALTSYFSAIAET
jgi:hypothetical protein